MPVCERRQLAVIFGERITSWAIYWRVHASVELFAPFATNW